MFAETKDSLITAEMTYHLGYRKIFRTQIWTCVDPHTKWRRREHTISLTGLFNTHSEALEAGVSFVERCQ